MESSPSLSAGQIQLPNGVAPSDAPAAEHDANRVAAEQVRRGAERLGQIAAHMEQFLAAQFEKIEHRINAQENTCDTDMERQTAAFVRLQDEFKEVRKKWDRERAVERGRLMEESRRLVQAWKELENEQREALKQRVLKPNNTPTGVTATGGRAPSKEHPPTAKEAKRDTETPEAIPATDSKMPTSRQGPAQFQQLRREMLEHARQRRKR